MTKRAVDIAVMVLALGVAARPARAQSSAFQFTRPPSTRAVNGAYAVRWEDRCAGCIDEGLTSITWYFATRPDGSDRRRMATQFREDFDGGFSRNWRAQGPFNFDWVVRKDRRQFLAGGGNAGPVVSVEPTSGSGVVSALVRPQNPNTGFGLGLRMTADGNSYEVRAAGDVLRLLQGGQVLLERPLPARLGRSWYWCEVGMQTRKGDVCIRVRLLNEERDRLLASFVLEHRPQDPMLLKPGSIALWGPADFAEVYVDPWPSRWLDDFKNEFTWDTSQVRDGDYYLVAELIDGKSRPRLVVSPYQVQVRNGEQARTGEPERGADPDRGGEKTAAN
jgi:hypothetical protein